MSKVNKKVLHEMKDIYYGNKEPYIDFMGNKITNDNYPTYHHVEKKADLKKAGKKTTPTVMNGAYLGKRSHELLHRLEYIDYDLYDCYNYIFEVIIRMGIYPIDDVWKMIDGLNESCKKLVKK